METSSEDISDTAQVFVCFWDGYEIDVDCFINSTKSNILYKSEKFWCTNA